MALRRVWACQRSSCSIDSHEHCVTTLPLHAPSVVRAASSHTTATMAARLSQAWRCSVHVPAALRLRQRHHRLWRPLQARGQAHHSSASSPFRPVHSLVTTSHGLSSAHHRWLHCITPRASAVLHSPSFSTLAAAPPQFTSATTTSSTAAASTSASTPASAAAGGSSAPRPPPSFRRRRYLAFAAVAVAVAVAVRGPEEVRVRRRLCTLSLSYRVRQTRVRAAVTYSCSVLALRSVCLRLTWSSSLASSAPR